ncbi:MAG TPA: hypothetical protein HA306_04025 [Methanosarcina sp.]|nr:hypothetical protein [Methanosarcina sp.]
MKVLLPGRFNRNTRKGRTMLNPSMPIKLTVSRGEAPFFIGELRVEADRFLL